MEPGMKTNVEHKPGDAHSGTPKFTIETQDDLALASQRIAALEAAVRGDEEERELAALQEAIRDWREKH